MDDDVEKSDADDNDSDLDSFASTSPSEQCSAHEVELILAERDGGDGVEYLVKWAGYDIKHCTWEPYQRFDSPQTLHDWEELKLSIRKGDVIAFNEPDFEKELEADEARKEERRKARTRRKASHTTSYQIVYDDDDTFMPDYVEDVSAPKEPTPERSQSALPTVSSPKLNNSPALLLEFPCVERELSVISTASTLFVPQESTQKKDESLSLRRKATMQPSSLLAAPERPKKKGRTSSLSTNTSISESQRPRSNEPSASGGRQSISAGPKQQPLTGQPRIPTSASTTKFSGFGTGWPTATRGRGNAARRGRFPMRGVVREVNLVPDPSALAIMRPQEFANRSRTGGTFENHNPASRHFRTDNSSTMPLQSPLTLVQCRPRGPGSPEPNSASRILPTSPRKESHMPLQERTENEIRPIPPKCPVKRFSGPNMIPARDSVRENISAPRPPPVGGFFYRPGRAGNDHKSVPRKMSRGGRQSGNEARQSWDLRRETHDHLPPRNSDHPYKTRGLWGTLRPDEVSLPIIKSRPFHSQNETLVQLFFGLKKTDFGLMRLHGTPPEVYEAVYKLKSGSKSEMWFQTEINLKDFKALIDAKHIISPPLCHAWVAEWTTGIQRPSLRKMTDDLFYKNSVAVFNLTNHAQIWAAFSPKSRTVSRDLSNEIFEPPAGQISFAIFRVSQVQSSQISKTVSTLSDGIPQSNPLSINARILLPGSRDFPAKTSGPPRQEPERISDGRNRTGGVGAPSAPRPPSDPRLKTLGPKAVSDSRFGNGSVDTGVISGSNGVSPAMDRKEQIQPSSDQTLEHQREANGSNGQKSAQDPTDIDISSPNSSLATIESVLNASAENRAAFFRQRGFFIDKLAFCQVGRPGGIFYLHFPSHKQQELCLFEAWLKDLKMKVCSSRDPQDWFDYVHDTKRGAVIFHEDFTQIGVLRPEIRSIISADFNFWTINLSKQLSFVDNAYSTPGKYCQAIFPWGTAILLTEDVLKDRLWMVKFITWLKLHNPADAKFGPIHLFLPPNTKETLRAGLSEFKSVEEYIHLGIVDLACEQSQHGEGIAMSPTFNTIDTISGHVSEDMDSTQREKSLVEAFAGLTMHYRTRIKESFVLASEKSESSGRSNWGHIKGTVYHKFPKRIVMPKDSEIWRDINEKVMLYKKVAELRKKDFAPEAPVAEAASTQAVTSATTAPFNLPSYVSYSS